MISKLKRSYYSTTGEVATKLNEVISELNELKNLFYDNLHLEQTPNPHNNWGKGWDKEPAKKEDVTPEPSQQVQNVTQGKPGCNPKLYLTAEGMRAYDGSKWV